MKKGTSDLVEKVHKVFKKEGLTLSVAESCTGGLISHYLTTLPGASTFFTGAIVSYSEDIKKDVLGVLSRTLLNHGVVSEQTAREMAEKVRLLTKTDYALSTTGNLGPDVMEKKERGLVYVAASREGKTVSQRLHLRGKRSENIEEASFSALKLLVDCLHDS
jgi:nicotinamide-nucleotide amidase